MATAAVENYLKCIFQEERRNPDALVSTGRISTLLGVSPASVTAMARTLGERGLADYEPYAGIRLTRSGERIALDTVRRHRLLERFLVDVVGMDWSEVHAEAERLEHVVSDRLVDRIDRMLGRPAVDPHGDPIPTVEGRVEDSEHPDLLSCPLGVELVITRVSDQRSEFLRYLDRHGFGLGRRLTILERDPMSEVVKVDLADRGRRAIGFAAAARIHATLAARA